MARPNIYTYITVNRHYIIKAAFNNNHTWGIISEHKQRTRIYDWEVVEGVVQFHNYGDERLPKYVRQITAYLADTVTQDSLSNMVSNQASINLRIQKNVSTR